MDPRYVRQADIVNQEALRRLKFDVIGVGAIGRQVALQLATMGAVHVTLTDFDTVETVNMGAQGFRPEHLGWPKVQAVATDMRQINPHIEVVEHNDRYTKSQRLGNVVFSCTDSMSVRRLIYDAICETEPDVDLLLDSRMAAELFELYSVISFPDADYPNTLFSDTDAFQASCTSKTTFYCASAAASFMVAHMVKWLRKCSIDARLSCNLLSMDLFKD